MIVFFGHFTVIRFCGVLLFFFERCGAFFSLLLVVACFLGRFGVFGEKVRVRSFFGTFLWLLGNLRNFLGFFVF